MSAHQQAAEAQGEVVRKMKEVTSQICSYQLAFYVLVSIWTLWACILTAIAQAMKADPTAHCKEDLDREVSKLKVRTISISSMRKDVYFSSGMHSGKQ